MTLIARAYRRISLPLKGGRFSTYAVGYVWRPFSGVVFGRLGDKIGRRAVLVLTLALMSTATTAMGLLPGYNAIGVWSPILLVALRFIQGVALGGEWAGAVLPSMEHGREAPVGEVLRNHWRRLLIAGGCRVGSDVIYVLVVAFTLTYVTTVLHLSRELALRAVVTGAVFNAGCVPLFGFLSDLFGRPIVYGSGAALAAVFAFVYFPLLNTQTEIFIIFAVVIGEVIHAMMFGPQGSFITEQFATPVRYTGAALAYTFAGVAGAGFAPLPMATLYQQFGTTLAISWYVLGALGITLVALWCAKETAKRPLED